MNYFIGHLVGDYLVQNDWMALNKKLSTLHCLVHVTLYTLSIWAFTHWPLWAIGIVFVTHFIQDRTTIINKWMLLVGQARFAQPPMAPWSVIVVDNVWHLVTLYMLACAVTRFG